MRRKPVVAAALTVAFAASAVAAELDIRGSYGNAAGCARVAGEHVFDDDLIYLTRTAVATYATHCSFLHVWKTESGTQVTPVICGHEGEADTTLGMMRFEKDWQRPEVMRIFDENGQHWGDLEPCL